MDFDPARLKYISIELVDGTGDARWERFSIDPPGTTSSTTSWRAPLSAEELRRLYEHQPAAAAAPEPAPVRHDWRQSPYERNLPDERSCRRITQRPYKFEWGNSQMIDPMQSFWRRIYGDFRNPGDTLFLNGLQHIAQTASKPENWQLSEHRVLPRTDENKFFRDDDEDRFQSFSIILFTDSSKRSKLLTIDASCEYKDLRPDEIKEKKWLLRWPQKKLSPEEEKKKKNEEQAIKERYRSINFNLKVTCPLYPWLDRFSGHVAAGLFDILKNNHRTVFEGKLIPPH